MVGVNITQAHKGLLSLFLSLKITLTALSNGFGKISVAYLVKPRPSVEGLITIPCGLVCPAVVSIMSDKVQAILIGRFEHVEQNASLVWPVSS